VAVQEERKGPEGERTERGRRAERKRGKGGRKKEAKCDKR